MRRLNLNVRYMSKRIAHGLACAVMGKVFDLLLGEEDEWLYEGSTTPDDR